MHYGKLGMKWGRHRAMSAAKAACPANHTKIQNGTIRRMTHDTI